MAETGGLVAIAVLLRVVGKGALSAGVALALGATPRTAILLGAGLAQLAESSFLLAHVARRLDLIDATLFGVLLSSAALSILPAPRVMGAGSRLFPVVQRTRLARRSEREPPRPERPEGHAIVCGYGRIGSVVAGLLGRFGATVLVIDEEPQLVHELRQRGVPALLGDAAQAPVLDGAGVGQARLLVVCVPERMSVQGVAEVVLGEQDLALELSRRSAQVLSLEVAALERVLDARSWHRGWWCASHPGVAAGSDLQNRWERWRRRYGDGRATLTRSSALQHATGPCLVPDRATPNKREPNSSEVPRE